MNICKNVALRARELKNGMLSLYLDYYPAYRNPDTRQVWKHESLGIYIYAKPRNARERKFNDEMMEKAEAIRCTRFTEVINERYAFFDQKRISQGDFLAYFKQQLKKHDMKWTYVYQHFCKYVDGVCTFGEINLSLCNGFKEYLLSARKLSNESKYISHNSAVGYWSTFRGLLKLLYRNKLIPENLNENLDKLDCVDVKKVALSSEEVVRLAETPCEIPLLKQAVLFSCLTGLRRSDILALRWEDIVDYEVGGKCLHIVTQKNKREDVIPISPEALQLIGYSPEKKGKVFAGFKISWLCYQMKNWIKQAGINKKISFHSFRRTFATLQAAAGTDPHTIQMLMGHRSIITTERYIKTVDQNLLDASARITLKRSSLNSGNPPTAP